MFKTMSSCLNKSARPTDDELNKIPGFLFCRYLSGSPQMILAANVFNQYHKIPVITQWKVIQSSFAGRRDIKYPKYPKAKKDDTIDIEQAIKTLQKKYDINREHAKDYLELLEDDYVEDLVEKYKDIV